MTEQEWLACADPKPMLEFLAGPSSTQRKALHGRRVPLTTYDHKRISERKSRLFACACCRRLWRVLDEKHCQHLVEYGRVAGSFKGLGLKEPPPDTCHRAVELVEQSADALVSAEPFLPLSEAADALHFPAGHYAACYGEDWGPFDTELMASGAAAYAVYHLSRECGASVDALGRTTGAFDCLQGVVWQTTQAVAYLKSTGFGEAVEGGDPQERVAQSALLREIVGNPFRPVSIDPSWQTPTVTNLATAAYQKRSLPSGKLQPARLAVLTDALEEAGCTNADILSHCRSAGPHVRGCWAVDLILGKQ
jgi:hypothetical protein